MKHEDVSGRDRRALDPTRLPYTSHHYDSRDCLYLTLRPPLDVAWRRCLLHAGAPSNAIGNGRSWSHSGRRLMTYDLCRQQPHAQDVQSGGLHGLRHGYSTTPSAGVALVKGGRMMPALDVFSAAAAVDEDDWAADAWEQSVLVGCSEVCVITFRVEVGPVEEDGLSAQDGPAKKDGRSTVSATPQSITFVLDDLVTALAVELETEAGYTVAYHMKLVDIQKLVSSWADPQCEMSGSPKKQPRSTDHRTVRALPPATAPCHAPAKPHQQQHQQHQQVPQSAGGARAPSAASGSNHCQSPPEAAVHTPVAGNLPLWVQAGDGWWRYLHDRGYWEERSGRRWSRNPWASGDCYDGPALESPFDV